MLRAIEWPADGFVEVTQAVRVDPEAAGDEPAERAGGGERKEGVEHRTSPCPPRRTACAAKPSAMFVQSTTARRDVKKILKNCYKKLQATSIEARARGLGELGSDLRRNDEFRWRMVFTRQVGPTIGAQLWLSK